MFGKDDNNCVQFTMKLRNVKLGDSACQFHEEFFVLPSGNAKSVKTEIMLKASEVCHPRCVFKL